MDERACGERASRTLVVIPTYNEAENIGAIVPAVRSALPGAHILVVDDNSPDQTGTLADELARADDHVEVLHRPKKGGLGTAYLEAFRRGLERGYDYLVEFDADFSHDPKYLPALLDAMARADVAVGSRYVPGGGTEHWGALRRFISAAGSTYARLVLGVPVRDLTAGLICWSRHALETIPLDRVGATGFAFQIEMKYRAALLGLTIEELPILFVERVAGHSKMSASIFFEALFRVWSLRLRVARERDES